MPFVDPVHSGGGITVLKYDSKNQLYESRRLLGDINLYEDWLAFGKNRLYVLKGYSSAYASHAGSSADTLRGEPDPMYLLAFKL